MSAIDKFEDFQPFSRAQWRDWLAENYDTRGGIWMVSFKKATGQARVSYDEAVEEALCFGWIDSLPRKLDDERSKLLFTPRKPGSVWSKLNKTRVQKLIESGAMTPIGLEKIEAAKKAGSWDALNRSDSLEIADDLAAALAKDQNAKANFDGFSDSVKRNVLAWIYGAKTAKTRRARVEKAVRMAANGLRANYDKAP